MKMDHPIYLMTDFTQEDKFGVSKNAMPPSKRLVFASVETVGQKEFFEGGRSGLNPEFKMSMFAYDYAGEQWLEYMGRVFSIYRTYQPTPDKVELYCSRKQGKR